MVGKGRDGAVTYDQLEPLPGNVAEVPDVGPYLPGRGLIHDTLVEGFEEALA